MIMIAKNYIEFRFRLFWDTLYSVDAITGISVWVIPSPEKNYTKISNSGSVVCF